MKEKLCIQVPKVYDWVTKEAEFHTSLCLVECYTTSDKICNDFTFPCSAEPKLLWEAQRDNIPHVGTISVSFHKGCGNELAVYINGNLAFSVGEGKTRVQTVESLHSVEISCTNGRGNCRGEYSLSIHHKYQRPYLPDPVDSLACYVTDPCGNCPISPDSIECIEIPQANGRQNKNMFMPTGQIVTFQKVNLLKKGTVVVELKRHGKICTELVPFEFTEELFLCAPKGTRIKCDITAIECTALLLEDESCAWIEVFITIGQCIRSEADVIVALEGKFCEPREDLSWLK